MPRFAAHVIVGSVLVASAVAQAQTPSAAQAGGRATLAQALQAAWSRSLEAAQTSGQHWRAQAEQAVAERWLADAPALELTQREARSTAEAGQRETELAVALPIWWPGLREANLRAAQAGLDEVRLAEQAARLRLAGQLREAAGSLRAAQLEQRLAELEQQLLQSLLSDVQRRVGAGDLAPADALATRAELLAAQTRLHESGLHLQTQRLRWQLLTGWEQVAEAEPAAAGGEAEMAAHPQLLLAGRVRERSRLRVDQAQAQSAGTPEVKLSVRQEQPAQEPGTRHGVAVGLRLPFGAAAYRQPQLAAALAEQELAEAAQERLQRQLQSERALAQAQVQAAASQAGTERERATLLRERAHLIELSFRLGESPLPELLRALTAAAQAEAGALRQQAAHELAQAQLRQALGILP